MPDVTPEDFERIVREHAAFVWRVLARHGVAAGQLEDVSQDVFLTLHRREVVTDAPPEPAAEHDADAFSALAEKESLELVHTLVARLPDEQREVFMLYEVDELTIREIAEALGCSQNTLFSRLYAARKALAAERARLRARRRVA